MTPTTEAGRADHEAAWSAAQRGEDWPTVHETSVEDCYGCRFIDRLWAEAAAAERERHGGHAIPGFEAAYEAGKLDGAAAERARLRGEVEALSKKRAWSHSHDYVLGYETMRKAILALLADPAEPEPTFPQRVGLANAYMLGWRPADPAEPEASE